MKRLLKLILVPLLSLSLFLSTISPAFAQSRLPGFMSQGDFVEALTSNQQNLTSWGMENLGGLIWGASALIGGVRFPDGTFQMGALQELTILQAKIYESKPISGQEYLADVGSRLGLAKPAYAQGVGFRAMEPVLGLWTTFRNISYLFFIVIFVALGFMIMFRSKLNPQTVISIQMALPKIIVGLVLVTFSYAISGFIIDLSDLTLKVVAAAFSDYANLSDQSTGIIPRLTNVYKCIGPDANSDGTCIDPANETKGYANIFTIMIPLLNVTGIASAIQDAITTVSDQLSAALGTFAFLAGGIVSLILNLAMLQAIFKTFFMLLTSYVSIILSTISSPFVFLGSALFGSQTISGWFKGFLANALVFPVSFTLLLLAAIFLHYAPISTSGNPWYTSRGPSASGAKENFSWYPAPLGIFWENQLDSNGNVVIDPSTGKAAKAFNLQLINYMIAFGIVLSVPRTLEIVKGVVEGKGAPGVGAEIGQTIQQSASKIPIVGSLIGG